MLDKKRTTPIIALIGAVALMTSAPAFAQSASPAASAAAASSAAPADSSASASPAAADSATPAVDAESLKVGGKSAGKLTPIRMILDATLIVKFVMIGLVLCSVLSWTLLVIKLFEFGSLSRTSD